MLHLAVLLQMLSLGGLFQGMIRDVKRRAPWYLSDWKDAWNYRVVPATVYMYFTKYVFYAT
jgi:HCO3- transporter family